VDGLPNSLSMRVPRSEHGQPRTALELIGDAVKGMGDAAAQVWLCLAGAGEFVAPRCLLECAHALFGED
jgi:hypothetical protein